MPREKRNTGEVTPGEYAKLRAKNRLGNAAKWAVRKTLHATWRVAVPVAGVSVLTRAVVGLAGDTVDQSVHFPIPGTNLEIGFGESDDLPEGFIANKRVISDWEGVNFGTFVISSKPSESKVIETPLATPAATPVDVFPSATPIP